jgi:RHH-type rel operon transcriptional repressor/antitoxin RelB
MLGVRIDDDLERKLEQLARRTQRTKSDLAREAIRLFVQKHDLAAEARRQSLAVAATDRPEDYLPVVDADCTP